MTEPPGGRHATAQNQAFAASLRASDEKNEDVFLQGMPSPRLHASLREELANKLNPTVGFWGAPGLQAALLHAAVMFLPSSPAAPPPVRPAAP